jgi:hypothetical protein
MEENKDRLILMETFDLEVEELESRQAPQIYGFATDAPDLDTPPNPIIPPSPI